MDNNDVLRRIRYIFDLSDSKMISLFGLAELKVSRAEISDWLKKEDDPAFQRITDKQLATFLNGFITDRRGRREGPAPVPEDRINNNIVLRKLTIGLHLRNDEILDIFRLADRKLSPHELSAFFRNPRHPKYRPCKDQYLRNFFSGLQVHYEGK